MDIKKIKQQSIAETLEKFKPFENLITSKRLSFPNESYLLNYIDSDQTTIDQIVKDFEDDAIIDMQDLVADIKAKLKEYRKGKEFFTEDFISNTINGDARTGATKKMFEDYCILCFWYNFELHYLNSLRSGKSIETSIKKFSDILEDKYKNKEDEIFALLGNHFPEFYDSEGKALNNKRNIKAILNSWFKLLIRESIIVLNPTKEKKEQICKVLLERCKFSDMSLSSKTLFDNDGIEVNPLFKKEYIELKNAIKSLNIK